MEDIPRSWEFEVLVGLPIPGSCEGGLKLMEDTSKSWDVEAPVDIVAPVDIEGRGDIEAPGDIETPVDFEASAGVEAPVDVQTCEASIEDISTLDWAAVVLLPIDGTTRLWLVSFSEAVKAIELDAWGELSVEDRDVAVSVARYTVALSLGEATLPVMDEKSILLRSPPATDDELGGLLRELEVSMFAEEDVSTAACPEFAEDTERAPDGAVPSPISDVLSGFVAEGPLPNVVLVAVVDEKVILLSSPLTSDDELGGLLRELDVSRLVEEDVSTAACPGFAEGFELAPEGDVTSPVLDVVSDSVTEGTLPTEGPLPTVGPLPSKLLLTIVVRLSEFPSNDDVSACDSVCTPDVMLVVDPSDVEA